MKTKLMIWAMLLLTVGGLRAEAPAQEAKTGGDAQTNKVASGPEYFYLYLDGELSERPQESIPLLSLGQHRLSWYELRTQLETIRKNPGLRGIIVVPGEFSAGLAQIEELGRALRAFLEDQKEVYIHAGTLTTPWYACFVNSTELCLTPGSDLYVNGLYLESLYFKELLDKCGISFDLLQLGAYKSGGEAFTRIAPSPAAAENLNSLLDGMYGRLVRQVATATGREPDQVRKMIDQAPYTAEQAQEAGFIRKVQFFDEFKKHLAKKAGGKIRLRYEAEEKAAPRPELLSNPFALFAMLMQPPKEGKPQKDTVALVYAEGMILDGHQKPDLFEEDNVCHSGDLERTMRKAAKNPKVKAVVLRINSPGGSAVASEKILRATQLVKKAGKPLIVSMGDVAASGGYYIACDADTIFADEFTLTGSIGVMGGKPVLADLLKKAGIANFPYQRGANADVVSIFSAFSPLQRSQMLAMMKGTYDKFKGHVSACRGAKLTKGIDELAEGRVFTGGQARDVGLVDEIGGLTEALAHAATRAGLKDYQVEILPRPKDFLEKLKELFSGKSAALGYVPPSTGQFLTPWSQNHGTGLLQAVSALDPRLLKVLLGALQKAELLQREKVMLVMPYELRFY